MGYRPTARTPDFDSGYLGSNPSIPIETCGRLTQLVEWLLYTQRVGGSSPSPAISTVLIGVHMSRSYRKLPIIQRCSETQKRWKSFYNRAMRRANRVLVTECLVDEEVDNTLWVYKHDVSDVWASPSDGWKHFFRVDFSLPYINYRGVDIRHRIMGK